MFYNIRIFIKIAHNSFFSNANLQQFQLFFLLVSCIGAGAASKCLTGAEQKTVFEDSSLRPIRIKTFLQNLKAPVQGAEGRGGGSEGDAAACRPASYTQGEALGE
jgi:hypothetical protein